MAQLGTILSNINFLYNGTSSLSVKLLGNMNTYFRIDQTSGNIILNKLLDNQIANFLVTLRACILLRLTFYSL